MKFSRVKLIVMAGALAFVGVIILQVYLLRQAFAYEEKKVSQQIQIALLDVSIAINRYYGYPQQISNPVEKLARDYYVVNMRNDFDAKILELLLRNTFTAKKIHQPFEYAIYDCETDGMIYGSLVQADSAEIALPKNSFPKAGHLVYYFAVRFPGLDNFIYASLEAWIALSVVMIIALSIFLYAIYIILQQQRFATLQKDFINNMTHEFKTPLASVLIAADSIARQESVIQNPRLQNYTRIITEQGKKLDAHLEKMLRTARTDERPDRLDIKIIHPLELIEQAAALIRLKHPEATISIQSETTAAINADPFHFGNIVYNFLDNAVKYTKSVPKIDIRLKLQQQHLLICFNDNGMGIPEKFHRKVFEKFFRIPGKSRETVNGFGLGLYYVKKICDLHQWKIAIRNLPEGGTCFTLKIPVNAKNQPI